MITGHSARWSGQPDREAAFLFGSRPARPGDRPDRRSHRAAAPSCGVAAGHPGPGTGRSRPAGKMDTARPSPEKVVRWPVERRRCSPRRWHGWSL